MNYPMCKPYYSSSSNYCILFFYRYIGWIQASYPTDTNHRLIDVLERATRSIMNHTGGFERYRNDNEYVKLWIAYADLVPDPAEIFKFLHSHRIGEDLALLYMAWAWVAEARGNYAFADKVYQRGIARKATPIERIQSRYRDFQRRMYRKWIDSQQQQQQQQQTATSSLSSKPLPIVPPTQFNFEKDFSHTIDLEALSIALHGTTAKSTENDNVHTGNNTNNNPRVVPLPANDENNNANRERAPLTRITSDAAARVHRERAYADDNAYANSEERVHEIAASTAVNPSSQNHPAQIYNGLTMGSHFPSRQQPPVQSSSSSSSRSTTVIPTHSTMHTDTEPPVVPIRNTNGNKNVPVTIFVEEPFISSSNTGTKSNAGFIPFNDELGTQINKQTLASSMNQPSNQVWKDFGTEAGRKKENTMLPTKWNDAPLVHHAGTREFEPNQKLDNANSRIPIFIDQELQDNNNSNNSKPYPLSSTHGGGLVERPVAPSVGGSGSSSNHVESLIANPLLNFQSNTNGTNNKGKETKPSMTATTTGTVNARPNAVSSVAVVQPDVPVMVQPTASVGPSNIVATTTASSSTVFTNETDSYEEIRARVWLQKNPKVANELNKQRMRSQSRLLQQPISSSAPPSQSVSTVSSTKVTAVPIIPTVQATEVPKKVLAPIAPDSTATFNGIQQYMNDNTATMQQFSHFSENDNTARPSLMGIFNAALDMTEQPNIPNVSNFGNKVVEPMPASLPTNTKPAFSIYSDDSSTNVVPFISVPVSKPKVMDQPILNTKNSIEIYQDEEITQERTASMSMLNQLLFSPSESKPATIVPSNVPVTKNNHNNNSNNKAVHIFSPDEQGKGKSAPVSFSIFNDEDISRIEPLPDSTAAFTTHLQSFSQAPPVVQMQSMSSGIQVYNENDDNDQLPPLMMDPSLPKDIAVSKIPFVAPTPAPPASKKVTIFSDFDNDTTNAKMTNKEVPYSTMKPPMKTGTNIPTTQVKRAALSSLAVPEIVPETPAPMNRRNNFSSENRPMKDGASNGSNVPQSIFKSMPKPIPGSVYSSSTNPNGNLTTSTGSSSTNPLAVSMLFSSVALPHTTNESAVSKADNEDMTINTRLAMEDMGDLFADVNSNINLPSFTTVKPSAITVTVPATKPPTNTNNNFVPKPNSMNNNTVPVYATGHHSSASIQPIATARSVLPPAVPHSSTIITNSSLSSSPLSMDQPTMPSSIITAQVLPAKQRELPPDARRLSMAFGAKRRESMNFVAKANTAITTATSTAIKPAPVVTATVAPSFPSTLPMKNSSTAGGPTFTIFEEDSTVHDDENNSSNLSSSSNPPVLPHAASLPVYVSPSGRSPVQISPIRTRPSSSPVVTTSTTNASHGKPLSFTIFSENDKTDNETNCDNNQENMAPLVHRGSAPPPSVSSSKFSIAPAFSSSSRSVLGTVQAPLQSFGHVEIHDTNVEAVEPVVSFTNQRTLPSRYENNPNVNFNIYSNVANEVSNTGTAIFPEYAMNRATYSRT